MPDYAYTCPKDGTFELNVPISQHRPMWECPDCGDSAPQTFRPDDVLSARIEDMESIGLDRRDPRTHGVNLGLPGHNVSLGKDSSGKEHFRYEPSRGVGSVREAHELARRNGLTPMDAGRYKSTHR